MVTISYDAARCRLSVEGRCDGPDDAATVEDALDAFEKLTERLTIDLTGATMLPVEVAQMLISAQRAARSEGRRLHLLRRSGSPVDDVLLEAASERPG